MLSLLIIGEQSSDFFTIKDYVETLDLKFKDRIYFNFNKTLSRGAFSFAEKTNNFKEMENLRANHGIVNRLFHHNFNVLQTVIIDLNSFYIILFKRFLKENQVLL